MFWGGGGDDFHLLVAWFVGLDPGSDSIAPASLELTVLFKLALNFQQDTDFRHVPPIFSLIISYLNSMLFLDP